MTSKMQLQFADTGLRQQILVELQGVTCDVCVVSFQSSAPNNLEKFSEHWKTGKKKIMNGKREIAKKYLIIIYEVLI